jgi:integrase
MHDYDEAMNTYIRSKRFEKLSINSKRIYMNGVDTLAPFFAGVALRKIDRPMVVAFRDTLYDQPGKCRVAISVLNNILRFAYDRGWVDRNVAANLGDLPPQKQIERWQEDEIDLFLSTAPAHVKDAMMLALYTGQRRSDLVRMLWTDIKDDVLYVKQRKTDVELWIPIHPKLKVYLDGVGKRKVSSVRQPFSRNHILTNHYGLPWVPESLRGAFKRHCAKIGLEGKQLHGVRKTTASILGEFGCTALQIMAITGHQSLKEVQRYTLGAEKRKLAEEAIIKWQ